ncbi:MAG: hypothetical protein ACOYOO_03905, partial [Saprospiraceae bacterium]
MCLSKDYLARSAVKSLLPPAAAEYYFERGCVKRFFLALRAKLYLDGDIFFLILRSKIRKNMSPSKEYFAAAGGENPFTQPQIFYTTPKYIFPGQ